MKQESIKILQDDLELLIEKHSEFVKKNDFGSALNVIKNIDNLTSQLKRIDYETVVSKYSIPDDAGGLKQLISIWQQNAFGEIKDIETWVLAEKYEENMYDFLSKLSMNWDTMSKDLKDNILNLFGGKREI